MEPPTDQPELATLMPTTAAYVCPSCGAGGEEVELTEHQDGQWRVPDEERFRHCGTCGAFIDVGWTGWQSHDHATDQGSDEP